MSTSENQTESRRVDEAILEYLQAEDLGTPIPMNELLAKYSDIREHLVNFFQDQGIIADAIKPFESTADQQKFHSHGKPNAPFMPEEFGEYVVWNELGVGGMGVVLAAYHRPLKRQVALKILKAEPNENPYLVTRFTEEAQIASQLQHPGIAPVHEIGRLPDGRPFFAMKLIAGKTFAELIQQSVQANTLEQDRPRYLQIFELICQTVAYAHSCKVLHRDLKPANVMVGSFGEVQVMDWGLGKVVTKGDSDRESKSLPIETLRTADDNLKTVHGQVVGTYAFMSPEQANGQLDLISPATDVFSLGAILCCILTGEPPYTGTTKSEIFTSAKLGQTDRAYQNAKAKNADPALIQLMEQCLAFDPNQRLQHGGDVAKAIRHYLDGVQEKLHLAELGKARAEASAVAEAKRRRAQLLAITTAALLITTSIAASIWYVYDRANRRQEEKALAERRAAEELRVQLAEENSGLQNYIGHLGRYRTLAVTKEVGWTKAALAELQAAAKIPFKGRDEVELRNAMFDIWQSYDAEWEPGIPFNASKVAFMAAHPDGEHVVVPQRTLKLQSNVSLDIVSISQKKVVRTLAFTPEGRLKNALQFKHDHDLAVKSLAFSPDGRWLLGANKAGQIYRWDWRDLKDTPMITTIPEAVPPERGINMICAETADASLLVAVSDIKQKKEYVVKINIATGEIVKTVLVDDSKWGCHITTGENGERLYVSTNTKTRQFFVRNMAEDQSFGKADDVRISSNNTTALGNVNGIAYLMDSRTLNPIRPLAHSVVSGTEGWEFGFGHRADYAFISDQQGVSFFSPTSGKPWVKIANTQTDTKVTSAAPMYHLSGVALLQQGQMRIARMNKPTMVSEECPHLGPIKRIATNANGITACLAIMSNSSIGLLTIWPTNESVSRPASMLGITLYIANDRQPQLAFTSKGHIVVGPCYMHLADDPKPPAPFIYVWNYETKQAVCRIPVDPKEALTNLRVDSQDRLWLLNLFGVTCWNTQTGAKISDHVNDLDKLTKTERLNGQLEVVGDTVLMPRVPRSGDLNMLVSSIPVTKPPTAYAQFPLTEIAALTHERLADRQLLIGSQTGMVAICDVKTKQLLTEIKQAHAGGISALIAIDDRRLITAGLDMRMKCWSVVGQQIKLNFESTIPALIKQMHLSPDGNHLYIIRDNERSVTRIKIRELLKKFEESGLPLR